MCVTCVNLKTRHEFGVLQEDSLRPNSDVVLRLPPEKLAMLQLAGVEMAPGSLHDWLRLAHAAASFLIGADYSVPDGTGQPPSSAMGASAQSATAQQRHPDVDNTAITSAYSRSQPHTAGSPDGGTGLCTPSTTSWHVLTAAAAAKRPVSSLAIKRWILVQKALVEEGRLTHAQLRYMAVLGAPVPRI